MARGHLPLVVKGTRMQTVTRLVNRVVYAAIAGWAAYLAVTWLLEHPGRILIAW